MTLSRELQEELWTDLTAEDAGKAQRAPVVLHRELTPLRSPRTRLLRPERAVVPGGEG